MKTFIYLAYISLLLGAASAAQANKKLEQLLKHDESIIQPKNTGTGNALSSSSEPLQCNVDDAAAKNGAPVTITTKVGPTGFIEILEYGIFASFYEDDQIITASNAPNCVAWVRSSNKPLSPAGDPFNQGADITASSSFYQNNPMQIEPDTTNFYLFNDAIYDATASATVQIETQGNVSMPHIPKLTLHSPGSGITKMINPVNVRDGNGGFKLLEIDSGKDYEIAWEPLTPAPRQRNGSIFILHCCIQPLWLKQNKPHQLLISVFCRTRPDTVILIGRGAYPHPERTTASTEVGIIPGIQVFAGEARLINLRDANYFVYITRSDSVDQLFPNGFSLLPSADCSKNTVKRLGCGLPVNGR